MNFNSVDELYKRVLPALELKAEELKEKDISTNPNEIFENLKNKKWTKSKNLTLYDIVKDILKYKREEGETNVKEDSNIR